MHVFLSHMDPLRNQEQLRSRRFKLHLLSFSMSLRQYARSTTESGIGPLKLLHPLNPASNFGRPVCNYVTVSIQQFAPLELQAHVA